MITAPAGSAERRQAVHAAIPGLVSVIVAVFNGRSEIESTLRSAFDQDYPQIEVVVIDGGSTDGTQEVVSAFKERVAVFVSERDHGIGDAWNKGLSACSGEFVALLNCGDQWPRNFVATHMKTLCTSPRAIQYGTTFMTRSGQVVERVGRSFDVVRLPDGFDFMHTSIMTSKAVYDEVGPFDIGKRIAVDTEWLLRALRQGVPFNQIDVHNFMASGGISSVHWLKGQLEYVDALKAHGFITGSSVRIESRKRLQSLYRRWGLHRIRRTSMVNLRTQIIYFSIAGINLLLRIVPTFGARHSLLRMFGVQIGKGTWVHRRLRLSARGRFQIGQDTVINRDCFFDNRLDIRIGKSVSIAHGCRIYTLGHDIEAPDFALKGAPVVIDDHVVLFAHAMVMPGVCIGRGAVVYAGAVVSRDVPALAVVAGNPARIVKTRPADACRYGLNFGKWLAP